MTKELKLQKLSFLLLPIILVCIGIRSYFVVVQKEDFYIDEVYSFFTSNNNLIKKSEVYEALRSAQIVQYAKNLKDSTLTKIFSYDEFKSNCYIRTNGFNYFNAYSIQMVDVHPPLYYLCLHTVCSITQSSDLILNGFIVNIVFLLLTCIFLYLIVIEILNDSWVALITVCFYGFSCEFVNNASFFRMYCLAAFWLVFLLYLYVRLSKKNWMLSNKMLLCICITQFMAMFTQYFSIMYIVPLFMYSIYKMRDDKQNRNRYIRYNIISTIIGVLLWPCVIFQLMYGSTQYSGFSVLALIKKLLVYGKLLVESLFAGQIIIFILFCLSILSGYIYRRKKFNSNFRDVKEYFIQNPPIFLLIVPSIIYFIMIALISPWPTFRYQSLIMPSLSVIIITTLYLLLRNLFRQKSIYLIVLGFMSVCSLSWKVSNVSSLYLESEEKKTFRGQYSDRDAILLDDNNLVIYIDIPLKYRHPRYIHSDNIHANAYLSDKLKKDEYILYVGDGADVSEISDLLEANNYSCEKIGYELQSWTVYHLKKVVYSL